MSTTRGRTILKHPLLLLLAALCTLAAQFALVAPTAARAADGRPGLRGDYYTSTGQGRFDFGELKATVVDPNIEFADLEPIFNLLTGRSDDVTVRWTGRITPEHSETYTFSIIGDNGFRLWIDNQLVIDHWVDDWDVEITGTPIALEAGRAYDFKLEFFEHYGGSHLRLRWESPSTPKQIVPPSAFTLPEGFEPPGPVTARVVESGDTAVLTFDKPLARLPKEAAEHFSLTIGGTAWPVKSATLDPRDRRVLRLGLQHPVPRQAGNNLRTSYDGQGGVAYADGGEFPAYVHVLVENGSTYTISTKWAKKVNPNRPLPEYPRPQLTRKDWSNLNGVWEFAPAREGEDPPFGRTLPERITVPFPVESTLSGINRHEDRMWYRRTFTVPASWAKKGRVLLHLDAVDYEAVVYVNGTQVGSHKGGYDRFTVDVTDALRPHGQQELIVYVADPSDRDRQALGKQHLNPQSIWYTTTSGIWQTVWLEPVPEAYISGLRTTPDVPGKALKATVTAEGEAAEVTLTARAKGRVVGTVSGAPGTELTLPVPDPILWTPENPFLYDLEVTLKDARGRTLDKAGSYFGMRSISIGKVDGMNRILLNGEPVFHFGPLDQGFWPDGIYTAPTDEALRFDLEQIKNFGYNAVRKHVKVEPDRWYYHADRLGLLVWQDMPSRFAARSAEDNAQFEAELKRIMDQHHNSPSVVMWVPFNEGWGQYDQARIADQVKAWDPSRLVNNMSGINCCGAVDGGNGDVADYHIYVGPGDPPAPTGDRATVLGEYGGLGLLVVGHSWSGGGWGYQGEPDANALTNHYLQLNEQLKRLRSCKGLSAAIYTQITDVEIEVNGLLTYDRAVVKPDVGKLRADNRDVIAGSPVAC
ncbi:MAG: PA14 domain-containing protein [Actinomycetes bacterium]